MKKVMFKDKPESNVYGQYNFPDDETTYTHADSNSVPIRYDKFSDKDLYTTVINNNMNTSILSGHLQYNKASYIHIDKLTIKNAGVNHDVTRINTHVYVGDNSNMLGDFEDMTYANAYAAMTGGGIIYSRTGQKKNEGTHLGDIIQDASILTNLYTDPQYPGDWSYAVEEGLSAENFLGEQPDIAVDNYSPIFNFTDQIIYIIVYTSGDENIKYWPDTDRRNRIHVFQINTHNDLIDGVNGAGGITNLSFEYADALIFEGGGDAAPAWKVTDLQVTINTTPDTALANYNPDPTYYPITGSVTPPVEVELGNFNSQILRINPSAQILSTTDYNYTPVSKTNILNSPYDLQNYYISDEDRQVASSPTQVSLDFKISTINKSDGVELTSTSFPTLGHMFYVVSWDDVDDKFKTWDDVIGDIPDDEVKLLEKQQDNLYIYNSISTPLINNYQVPGLKTIKSVMFSHDTNTEDDSIEPVRWKFITTRIFLDIPVNQFPDFGEVGGSDYTTIPWPHTTLVIGGTDEDSKYKISVQDILSGGKIGNTDIIDQTFLINANENDELGQSIRKFDLEQVRYFNSSYDMASLLGIDIVIEGDNTDYFGTCDFGFFVSPNAAGGGFTGTTEEEAYEFALTWWLETTYQLCTAEPPEGSWRFTVCCPNGSLTQSTLQCADNPGGDVSIVLVANPITGETINANGIMEVDPEFPGSYATACGTFEPGTFNPHTDSEHWDGETNSFSEETSVGEIFISDNSDATLKQDCKLELNCGNLTGKSIVDSSGNSNKGLLIGDYKIKKTRKNRPMRRDSFIKIPKKNSNSNGAL